PTQVFISPKGRAYRITVSQERVPEFERRGEFSADVAPSPDDFIGHDRKKAKTSIAVAPVEPFAGVGELLDDLLANTPDDAMRNRTPRISKAEDSDRVPEERRNVTLTGWLYAVKKEANDNDYHLIVGTDPNGVPIRYMNMEISGLPAAEP